MIQRYLYKSDSNVLLSHEGLFIKQASSWFYSGNSLAIKEVLNLKGGIIIAEAGMGKTTYLNQLKDNFVGHSVKLVELGLYHGDPSGLRDDINKAINLASSSLQKLVLLLDGLDEAPDLAGVVCRIIESLPLETVLWIATRDIPAIKSLKDVRKDLETFNLAPLSDDNIKALAKFKQVDGESFFNAAFNRGILPLCSKPLGCELAISVFSDHGLENISHNDLWNNGIKKLCDETPSKTRRLVAPSPYSAEEILSCSAWVALCMSLVDKHLIWVGEDTCCPPNCLTIHALTNNEFTNDLLRTTLTRGLFRPQGDDNIIFSHKAYQDYATAIGFEKFIKPDGWASLLFKPSDKVVYPQRAGAVSWLAVFNEGFRAKIFEIQPALLLSAPDAIQSIGPDKICHELIENAKIMSHQQLDADFVKRNLYVLKNQKVVEILHEYLQKQDIEPKQLKLIINIAVACDYQDLATVLAEKVLDANLALHDRVEAGYGVFKLGDENAKAKLKQLLPIRQDEDQGDELLGIVLKNCWPNHLTEIELTNNLIEPQNKSLLRAYRAFLLLDLPEHLKNKLHVDAAKFWLNWAIAHIQEDSYPHRKHELAELARKIYSIYWCLASNPKIADLLAKGYVKAISHHQSPFEYIFDKDKRLKFFDDYSNDSIRRFAVLESILPQHEMDEIEKFLLCFKEPYLFSRDDFEILADKFATNSHGPLAEKWMFCIKELLRFGIKVEAYEDILTHLHLLRPDLLDSFPQIAENQKAIQKIHELYQEEQQVRQDERNKSEEISVNNYKTWLINTLSKKPLSPGHFSSICSFLFDDNISDISIQKMPRWLELEDEYRLKIIELAELYLKSPLLERTAPGQITFSVVRALSILKDYQPAIYERLPESVWQNCGVEFLKAVYPENLGQASPILDTLATHFSETATNLLLEVIKQECQRDFVSIIDIWGGRLTIEQAKAIVSMLADSTFNINNRHLVIDKMIRGNCRTVAADYLSEIFENGWAVPQDPAYNQLRRIALCDAPEKYMPQVITALNRDAAWGREFLETTISSTDRMEAGFFKAISSCDISIISDFYICLHRQYPTRKKLNDEIGGWVTPIGSIYKIKRLIIDLLTTKGRNGSVASLEKIYKEFPEDTWLLDCIKNAKDAELAKQLPMLSISDIQKLYCEKNAASVLIHSADDLMALLINELNEYQIHLQGDNQAIRYLWYEYTAGQYCMRPRSEEDLSDHLKHYLDLKITSGIVINREVQIRRKLYKDGIAGSRTDLWIQAIDKKNNQVITVCIEVKCNWNPETPTALKKQLIGKYLSGGTASGGILLLGWFECAHWDAEDHRLKKSTNQWANKDLAEKYLNRQAEAERQNGHNVLPFVLDCKIN